MTDLPSIPTRVLTRCLSAIVAHDKTRYTDRGYQGKRAYDQASPPPNKRWMTPAEIAERLLEIMEMPFDPSVLEGEDFVVSLEVPKQ